MLSDRCLTVPSCPVCPLCDVGVCGQAVRWIKKPLGMEVGLGSGHTVLDGDPALTKRGTAALIHFSAHFALARSPISATAEPLLKTGQHSQP